MHAPTMRAGALCLLACLSNPVSGFAPTSFLPSAAMRSRGSPAVSRIAMEGGVGRSSIELLDALTSGIASAVRPTSSFVAGYRAQLDQTYKSTFDLPLREFSENLPKNKPRQTLELYEFEACPFCRKVRIGHVVFPKGEGCEGIVEVCSELHRTHSWQRGLW